MKKFLYKFVSCFMAALVTTASVDIKVGAAESTADNSINELVQVAETEINTQPAKRSEVEIVYHPEVLGVAGGYYSGNCGTDVKWILDDGLLTISGNGVVEGRVNGGQYLKYSREITSIEIGNGITGISKSAFANCENLRQVTFSDSVKQIGDSAFSGCNQLEKVYFLGTDGKNGSGDQWSVIQIADGNDVLKNAKRIYVDRFVDVIFLDEREQSALRDSKSVAYGRPYGKLPEPDWDGHNFLGWFDGEKKVTDTTLVPYLKGHTLQAKWEIQPQVMAVKTDVASGVIALNHPVVLSTDTNDAKIYYTLGDGDFSEDAWILYQEPIIVTQDIKIRTIAVKEKYRNSVISEFSYSVYDASQDWGEVPDSVVREMGFKNADEIPTGLWVYGIPKTAVEYTATAHTFPDAKVFRHKSMLLSGVDYTIKYTNNLKAGQATVTITGKGNYTGKIIVNFTIKQRDLKQISFKNPDLVLEYNGKVQKGIPTLSFEENGKKITLKKGTDFDLFYPALTTDSSEHSPYAYRDPGTYPIEVVGKGNYTGKLSITEQITRSISIKKVSAKAIPKQSYTGKPIRVDQLIQLTYKKEQLRGCELSEYKTLSEENKKNYDYTFEYGENIASGECLIRIVGKNEFVGIRDLKFSIVGQAIKSASVTNLNAMEYTGKAIEPVPKVEINTGSKTAPAYKTLKGLSQADYKKADEETKRNIDFCYTYKNNVKVGKASVVITGVNGYTGTVTKTFTIQKKEMKEGNCRFYTEDQNLNDLKASDFYVLQTSDMSYQKSGAKAPAVVYWRTLSEDGKTQYIRLTEKQDYTVKYSGNKKKGSVATMEIVGKGNFAGKIIMTYRITPGRMKETTVLVDDVVYKRTPGICKPSVTILDQQGGKLQAGTDFDKNLVYTYKEDTVVEVLTTTKGIKSYKQQLRKAKEEVLKTDIVPVGAVIQVMFAGINNYNGSTVMGEFRYVESSVSKAKISVKSQSYTGKEICPGKDDIEIIIGKKKLGKADFEIVGYSNNVKKGFGKIIVRGVGEYGGVKTVNFIIAPKWLSLDERNR